MYKKGAKVAPSKIRSHKSQNWQISYIYGFFLCVGYTLQICYACNQLKIIWLNVWK